MQSNPIPLDRLCGLNPDLWLSVGAAFSREDVKALVLGQGRGFVGEAIVNLQEICLKITGFSKEKLMTPSFRQEVLRTLLSEPKIVTSLPLVKRIKRQRNFVKSLDLAIQSGRMTSAHAEEALVYEERLSQGVGENPLRQELIALSNAYEAWTVSLGYFDIPILIREATRVLNETGWPSALPKPEEIWSLSVECVESLEQEFWETLRRFVGVKQVRSLYEPQGQPQFSWQRWHTLDDAAEYLADQFSILTKNENWNDHVILIPDIPVVRRSLMRALASRGLPLADPRDPTRLRWDENLKWALLPLEVVAWNFERKRVVSYLGTHSLDLQPAISETSVKSNGQNHHQNYDQVHAGHNNAGHNNAGHNNAGHNNAGHNNAGHNNAGHNNAGHNNAGHNNAGHNNAAMIHEISSRGIRHGLFAYAGGLLVGLHEHLQRLSQSLGGRKTCQELSEAHLQFLKKAVENSAERAWLVPFFEMTWKSFIADSERTEQSHRKAPLLFWFERLQSRLSEASPPVERLKPEVGIRIYRLQQAPVFPAKKVWCFGLPAYWLSGEGLGNYWFSERERELLSAEFAVRSSIQVREDRLTVLKSWMTESSEVTVLDAHYHSNGRECESILPVIKELELSLGTVLADEPTDQGAHPRYQKSYGVLRPIQAQEISLPPMPKRPGGELPLLSATLLDHSSRCSFLGLTYHRWNLKDVREPDIELWPEIKGRMLHEAVRILLESLDSEGLFQIDSKSALEKAWNRHRPKGLIRNSRVENYVKSRMILILDVFCEKEREYLKRAEARPYRLENVDFRIDYPEFSVIGKPDRIDIHKDGLFIIDFKSSGSSPHGSEMVERGYRLQLPFYALAAQKEFKKAVLGVQFIELTRKGNRRSGIFFKPHNGKEPGKLTNLRSNSKSLLLTEPSDAWAQVESHLISNANRYIQGQFKANPNTDSRDKECSRCRMSDVCGWRRLVKVEEKEEISHE